MSPIPRYEYVCMTCGVVHDHFQSIHDDLPDIDCLACGAPMGRTLSANIQFPYGQRQFHDQTLKESIDEQHRGAAAIGDTLEPVGTRWV